MRWWGSRNGCLPGGWANNEQTEDQENERGDKKRTIHERKQKRAFLTEEERSGKGSQDSGVKALTIAIQKTTPT